MGLVEIAHPRAILSNLVAALGGAGCRRGTSSGLARPPGAEIPPLSRESDGMKKVFILFTHPRLWVLCREATTRPLAPTCRGFSLIMQPNAPAIGHPAGIAWWGVNLCATA